MAGNNTEPWVVLDDLHKSYGGVRALRGVSLSLCAGQVHALCGENGAGKSTLIKCLTGVLQPDQGTATVGRLPWKWGDVAAAERNGIAVIHQESTVFPDLNVVDNLFVGHAPCRGGGWWIDRRRMHNTALELMERLEIDVPLHAPVGQFSIGQRKLISVARALVRNCRVLVLDEPTAALSAKETELIKRMVKRLRNDGLCILYVSHRLEEIFELADQVTVLRDGRRISTHATSQRTPAQLIHDMVGRPVEEPVRPTSSTPSSREVVLRVEQLSGVGFRDVSCEVHAGEIVGLAGLVGAGRTELAQALFGIVPPTSGSIFVNGRPLALRSPEQAIRAGIALVPEDRQRDGLILPMSVGENLTLAVLRQLRGWFGIRRHQEQTMVERLIQELWIKTADPRRPVANLSGGNQQKVVMGKWLACQPRLLILDEPTAGMDVGAKAQVHRLIHALSEQGMATLMISSDMPELLTMCDRISVMREGIVRTTLNRAEATPEAILQAALPPGN